MTLIKRFGWVAVTASLALGLMLITRPAYAEPLPLETYGDLEAVEDMALSPNGSQYAVLARVKGERRLVATGQDGTVRINTPVGEMKVRSVYWSGNDLVAVSYTQTTNLGPEFTKHRMELAGVLLIPLDGGKPRQVFGDNPNMMNAVFGGYGLRTVSGRPTGYFGGLEYRRDSSGKGTGYVFDHGRPALFAVDMEKNDPRRIARAASENHDNEWLVDGDGKLAVTLDIGGSGIDLGKWRLLNAQGSEIAGGTDKTASIALIALGRDGTSVIYGQDDDAAGKTRLFEVPLAGGATSEFLPDANIERTFIDRANGRLLGYVEQGEGRRPVMFDPAHQAAMTKVYRAFGKHDLRIVDWTENFAHVLLHISGGADSGTWYVVDLARMKADPVGYDRPAIGPERIGPVSVFAYPAADGMELDGVLTLPPGREARNLPVVIFPHGGPQDHDSVTFNWWAQAFASRGYAVFQPNFRGSTNRDLAFQRAGYGQWGRKMQTDLSDGLAALAKQGIVDPKRACIMGASYGGYAALAGVTLQSGLYRCAVAVAPVSDLREMYNTDYLESGGSSLMRNILRESLGHPSTFDDVSPRRHAGGASAPILLIHGRDDTRVPFRHSTSMADALRNAGKPYELVELREEDHFLSRPATRKQMLEAAMRFVQQHNPAN